jgi:hypothetical protein
MGEVARETRRRGSRGRRRVTMRIMTDGVWNHKKTWVARLETS